MFLHRQTSLSANVVAFCRYLRREGYFLSAQEEADALAAMELLDPFQSSQHFRGALKSVLCRNREQVENFDGHYDFYWSQVEKGVDSKIAQRESEKNRRPPAAGSDPAFSALKDWLLGNREQEEEIETHSYSSVEVLSKKDFSTLTANELREVFELIRMLARRLARQRNRRFENDPQGSMDLRKTLRQNLRHGGEMLKIFSKKPRKRRRRLVLLCDVSKSMELYSRFLLQFAYAVQQVFKKMEAFVFSTSLVHISPALRQGSFEEMGTELSQSVPNWSGGTRIGGSLDSFLKDFAPKYLHPNTVVVLLSDGWDTGEPELLAESMSLLHRKAGKVIWLNPLAGNPNFKAETAGMAAAMPFIDVFAPAHNVESLRRLSKMIR